jgi:hypothetical protein
MTTADYFAPLIKHKFILLTTFRKSGVGVPTPVWFVQDGDRLVFTTSQETGKAKRLRNNPRVTLAPCTYSGKPLGATLEGKARFLPESEFVSAEALFKMCYRVQFKLLSWLWHRRGMPMLYLEITPP